MHGKKQNKRNDFRRQFLDPIEEKLKRQRKNHLRQQAQRGGFYDQEDSESVHDSRYR